MAIIPLQTPEEHKRLQRQLEELQRRREKARERIIAVVLIVALFAFVGYACVPRDNYNGGVEYPYGSGPEAWPY